MNAPFTPPPRNLANVLVELRQAKRDWNDALDADDPDSDDRMAEAEQREEALREEFDRMFREATGLTWKVIETAVSEAVL
jgi:hypothetical protein